MMIKRHMMVLGVTLALLLSAGREAAAQRFAVGTNAVDLATFGTLNIDAAYGMGRGFSFHAGVEYNPWTFSKHVEGRQFQLRQTTVQGGVRWWPWFVFSGWWVGMDVRHTAYNAGGFLMGGGAQEGYATGGGFSGGYSRMLSIHWNLDFGFGFWAGSRSYKTYNCAYCGAVTAEGRKLFFLPDARVAIMYIF